MNIVNKPLSEIIPYNKNPRKNDNAVDAVARSIKEFGFKNPVLIDPHNVIICGHTRYKAAIKLGLETVPCIVADDLTDKQVKAFRIADNKLSELARWDFPLLTGELADLKDLFNFEDFGFSEKESRDLIGVHDVQEDNFDIDGELKKPAISKTGDIWILGKHRVMCADSTIEENVKQLMGPDLADLVVTDPPYNVDYGSKADAINKYGYRFSDRHIQNDYMPELEFIDFLDKAFKNMNAVMKPGAAFYIWHASITVYEFETALRQNNLKTRQQLIWCKNSIVLGRQDYQWKHEPCQKPGTKVTMEGGALKDIQDIKSGDRVIGLNRASLQLVGWNKSGTGSKVTRVASRDYDGKIYHITVVDKQTNATDNHKFTVRYNREEAKKFYVYLMKKGNWWRVGISQLQNSRGSGMRDRLRGENGDVMWVVSKGFDTKTEAVIEETIISCKYGIPQTIWNTGKTGRIVIKTNPQIARIYDEIGEQNIQDGAKRLLGDRIRYPQIVHRRGMESTRHGFSVEACNLMPKVFEVLMPAKDAFETIVARYAQIEDIKTEAYNGKVYSLSVEGEHYISDGIVTHNCLYGWKEGGPHSFVNDRTVSTLIEDEPRDFSKMKKEDLIQLLDLIHSELVPVSIIHVNKPGRSAEHPTMKPLNLLAGLIINSSKRDGLVLDLFGGSGSTLMASEQLKRKCYMMEIDQKYTDVIVNRYIKLTNDRDNIYIIRDGMQTKYADITGL